jgi:GNAT superfamily N-acetyltransferase
MILRRAVEDDARAILPLLRQLGYDQLDERGARGKIKSYGLPDYAVIVAVVSGQVVGFISLHVVEIFHSPGKAGRITAFCVDQNFRSQGIGIRLLQEGEDYFRSEGCKKVEVTSNNRRTDTHEFYINRGYKDDSKKFVLVL